MAHGSLVHQFDLVFQSYVPYYNIRQTNVCLSFLEPTTSALNIFRLWEGGVCVWGVCVIFFFWFETGKVYFLSQNIGIKHTCHILLHIVLFVFQPEDQEENLWKNTMSNITKVDDDFHHTTEMYFLWKMYKKQTNKQTKNMCAKMAILKEMHVGCWDNPPSFALCKLIFSYQDLHHSSICYCTMYMHSKWPKWTPIWDIYTRQGAVELIVLKHGATILLPYDINISTPYFHNCTSRPYANKQNDTEVLWDQQLHNLQTNLFKSFKDNSQNSYVIYQIPLSQCIFFKLGTI